MITGCLGPRDVGEINQKLSTADGEPDMGIDADKPDSSPAHDVAIEGIELDEIGTCDASVQMIEPYEETDIGPTDMNAFEESEDEELDLGTATDVAVHIPNR